MSDRDDKAIGGMGASARPGDVCLNGDAPRDDRHLRGGNCGIGVDGAMLAAALTAETA